MRVAPLQKLVVNYSLLSIHWLNSWTLAAIDLSERLHLLDVHSHEELENLDISNIGLVYESSHFKGILTGGNVSRAMVSKSYYFIKLNFHNLTLFKIFLWTLQALAGEKACYNTIVSYGNQILILGTKSIHVLNIRPWTERLNYLVKQVRLYFVK